MSLHRQQGVSLVEVMIATSIGLILLLAVIQVFAASQAACSISQGLARVQENGRFAMEYLRRDIRMAGHMGCASDAILSQEMNGAEFLEKFTLFGTDAPSALSFNYAIQGYEATGTGPNSDVTLAAPPMLGGVFNPSLPHDLAGALSNRIAGSDILVLRYLDGSGLPITEKALGRAPTLSLAATGTDWEQLRGGIDQPGLFGLSRCRGVRLFHAASVADGRSIRVGNASNSLNAGSGASSFDFDAGSMLYRAESEVYYVGLNMLTRHPSLYRLRFLASPGKGLSYEKQELVDGVENMQLLYAQGSGNGDSSPMAINQLRTAAEIHTSSVDTESAWRQVFSVQIGLLVVSPDPASVLKSKDKLISQGVTFDVPTDGRMRSVYQGSVTLRNRL